MKALDEATLRKRRDRLLNPIVATNDDFLFIRPAVMTARSTSYTHPKNLNIKI